jgi:hypothetical protein
VVEKVFIDGILAYEREKDVRLKRLLSMDAEEASPQRQQAEKRPSEENAE